MSLTRTLYNCNPLFFILPILCCSLHLGNIHCNSLPILLLMYVSPHNTNAEIPRHIMINVGGTKVGRKPWNLPLLLAIPEGHLCRHPVSREDSTASCPLLVSGFPSSFMCVQTFICRHTSHITLTNIFLKKFIHITSVLFPSNRIGHNLSILWV